LPQLFADERKSLEAVKAGYDEYNSPRQARQMVDDYLHFYNHRRPHQALDYQTPAEEYAHHDTPGGLDIHPTRGQSYVSSHLPSNIHFTTVDILSSY